MQSTLTNRIIRLPASFTASCASPRCAWPGRTWAVAAGFAMWMCPCDPWDLWIDDRVSLDNRVVLCLNGESTGQPKILIHAGTTSIVYTVIDAVVRVQIGATA
jgi:hypothetical protein